MNLQYISDNKGKTTGVFIPINDWEYLKNKYKEIESEEENNFDVPEWDKKLIMERLAEYKENPDEVIDWNESQKEIETKYDF